MSLCRNKKIERILDKIPKGRAHFMYVNFKMHEHIPIDIDGGVIWSKVPFESIDLAECKDATLPAVETFKLFEAKIGCRLELTLAQYLSISSSIRGVSCLFSFRFRPRFELSTWFESSIEAEVSTEKKHEW